MQPVVINYNSKYANCQYHLRKFAITKEVIPLTLTERIKTLADPLELSFSAIEKSLGFGNGTIRRWDNNAPSADKLLSVANMLDSSIDYLLTGQNPPSHLINSEDAEWLSLLHQLDEDDRKAYFAEIKGFIKGKSSTK